VGWSSIASGVWEDKHGVDGSKFNMDPGQATKNGYLDFLTRIEDLRKRTSTFLASDWDNIGLALNGGPIFGTAMDANFAARVPMESIALWDQGDEQVTDAASRYLRTGDPDAGFVYLGLVDETAHLAGSATPTYAQAIRTTDGRIGRLLRAIRSRPTYAFESWTILVTTDHGQKPLTEPSVISHFGDTKLERTSFVIGSGPGLGRNVKKPKVVDILPTVLHGLGLRASPSWNLDGHTLSKVAGGASASARLRGGRLVAKLRLGAATRARGIDFHLASRARGAAKVRVNGAAAGAVTEGRTVRVALGGRKLRSVSLTVPVRTGGGSLVVTLRGGHGGKLSIPLR
jgi:Type I phosphodiesterase / nucleotide pyrophosphatase